MMQHFRKAVLMAALSNEGAQSGSAAAPQVGVPDVDSKEFEAHYRAAKTGVPMSDALDFHKFLDAVINGGFFGTKYAMKFCNEDGKTTEQGIWIKSMSLNYAGRERKVSLLLGARGIKVCDALYGEGNGPVVMPFPSKEKAPKGRKMYQPRSTVDGFDNGFETGYVPLKPRYKDM